MKFYKVWIIFTVSFFIFSFNYNVFSDDEDLEDISDVSSFIETTTNVSEEPIINSRAAIIFDRNSGYVLFGKNENEQRKMASTTKIMSAIIVIDGSLTHSF